MVPTSNAAVSAPVASPTVVRDLNGRAVGLLAVTVSWFAPLLLVYVSVEPAALGLLPAAWYWPARLLPDVLICALVAASILIFGRRQPVQNLAAGAVLAIAVAITVLDVARGQSASDAINALRVVIRYLLLGLLFWWVASMERPVMARVLVAIAIACGIQIVAAAGQAGGWIAGGGSIFAIPALDGLTGRYDRLGLLLMVASLVIISVGWSGRRWLVGILPVLLVLLFLTSSRQAEVALAAGCVLIALLPRQTGMSRVLPALVVVCAIAMLARTPSRITLASVEDAPPAPVPGAIGFGSDAGSTLPERPPAQAKGSTQLSIDPNRNFRLYLLVLLAPWAAQQEPVLGFGPGAQIAADPDARLGAKLEADGTTWTWARSFMNDSTYASWIIQFGVLAPATLFAGLLAAALLLGRATWRGRGGRYPGLALALLAAMLSAAFFGPVFETRLSSLAFWLILFGSLAVVRLRASEKAMSSLPPTPA